MSELNYGVNVENLLHDLSQHESSDIGEFDVYGEDEQGREGCASIDITLLASDALKVIGTLKAEHAELLKKFNFKQNLTDQVINLQKQRDALAADNAMRGEIIERLIGHYSAAGYHAVQNSLNPAQSLLFDAMQVMKQPATDAYLNSVRAEGVDDLATFAGQQYQQHAGDKAQQKKWKSIVFLCTQFAAQLRAGKDGE